MTPAPERYLRKSPFWSVHASHLAEQVFASRLARASFLVALADGVDPACGRCIPAGMFGLRSSAFAARDASARVRR
jgi:hypothetical protein